MHDDGRKEISKATRVFLSEIKIKAKKRNGHVCAKNKIFRDRWFNVIFAEVFTVAFSMQLLSGVQRLLFILFLFLAELSTGVCQTSME